MPAPLPRRSLALALLAALVATAPAAAEPPPALVEEAEEAFATCADLGGAPRILDGYRTEADLNGDGIGDFVTDLARLECAGAWTAFCGMAGCPVAVWLSEPDGGYRRVDLGLVQAFEILLGSGGALPTLRASYHPALCGQEAPPGGCTRSWVFDTNAPDTPPVDRLPDPEPVPEPEPGPAQQVEAAPQDAPVADAAPLVPVVPVAPGWTLRRVPGSGPVAVGGGTGRVASLAVFCLQDVPFLAVRFLEPPAGASVALEFVFGDGAVAAEAGREETAGGAYVLALAEGPLADRLAGRDSRVPLRVDGRDEGTLSLVGSTAAIRGALADCGPR